MLTVSYWPKSAVACEILPNARNSAGNVIRRPSAAIQPSPLTSYPAHPANGRNQQFGHSILGFVLQPALGLSDSVRLSEPQVRIPEVTRMMHE
jgi:hypothetical protein